MRRLLLALAFVLVSGCGDLKEGLADAKRTEADIKSELHVDAQVSFRTFTGTKGKNTSVTVHLMTAPSGDANEVKTKVTDIVNRDFRSHVDSVSVSF
jgi:hypothetical protein